MTQLRGAALLMVDVAGSSLLGTYDHELLLELTRSLVEVLVPDTIQFVAAGDTSLAIFRDAEEAYAALKHLAIWWREYPLEVEQVPVGVGLRVSLHVGDVEILSERRGVVGHAINFAARLSSVAEVDTIVVSEVAHAALSQHLMADGVTIAVRTAQLKGIPDARWYGFPLSALARTKDYFITFGTPTDLVLYLSSQPAELVQIQPRKFEEVVAELLSDAGYRVELTQTTRDDGIDIIALARSLPLGLAERYLIQCKRHGPENRVGVGIVRDLLGVGALEPHTGLMLVTTSTFTGPARRLALKETVRWRLHLRDYDTLKEWLDRYAGKRRAVVGA